MEHNEENQDLTPGKIDTTTDSDNAQSEGDSFISGRELNRLTIRSHFNNLHSMALLTK